MRILNNPDIAGFGIHEATLNPAIWLLAPPTVRGNPILSSGTSDSSGDQEEASRQTPTTPEKLDLADDDFPFSALIRLVRQMRQ